MVTWIETYASIIGFFVQIVFYIVVAGSALWAAITFQKYVRFMTVGDEGVADSGDKGEEGKAKGDEVPVDEFVE